MRFKKLAPPGTWCLREAVLELMRRTGGTSFIEVGCGAGDLSLELCDRGYRGVGLDFSARALSEAREALKPHIERRAFRLVQGDVFDLAPPNDLVDWGISMMVMEHVEDDLEFVRKIKAHLRPGGHVLIGVPGRRDHWGIEDETAGHLRRYDKVDLKRVLEQAALDDVRVLSIAVPIANILFHAGNWLIRNSNEREKTRQPLREQTETSGIRRVPFKTVFPWPCKLLLNHWTLYPWLATQKLFYGTNLGITLLGIGRA